MRILVLLLRVGRMPPASWGLLVRLPQQLVSILQNSNQSMCIPSMHAVSLISLVSCWPALCHADLCCCSIRVPGSIGCASDRNRSNSLARRRAAIDISPRAVQRLSDKVALLDAGHIDVDGGGVTRTEVEALYTDMQLIHRGRCVKDQAERASRVGEGWDFLWGAVPLIKLMTAELITA